MEGLLEKNEGAIYSRDRLVQFLNKRGVKVNLMDPRAFKTQLLDRDRNNIKAHVIELRGIIVRLSARDTQALYEVGLYSPRSEQPELKKVSRDFGPNRLHSFTQLPGWWLVKHP